LRNDGKNAGRCCHAYC
jgi:uncharacterized surface protein with fasciclin (FAS1) repeats